MLLVGIGCGLCYFIYRQYARKSLPDEEISVSGESDPLSGLEGSILRFRDS